MNQLQLKIYLNQFKYGSIFMIVLTIMHKFDLYGLKSTDEEYCILYTDLCESFFETLIKEITYHNYILLLNHDNYLQLIENCLNKSIHLKNREYYNIQVNRQKELCTFIYEPLVQYLDQLKNQIKMHIEIHPLNQSTNDDINIQIVSGEDLEKKLQNMRNKQSSDNQMKKQSNYQL